MKEKKEIVMIAAAVGVLLVGCVMLCVSLIMPPPGEIDHSVLVAFGEMLTFTGTMFGVSLGRNLNKKNYEEDR